MKPSFRLRPAAKNKPPQAAVNAARTFYATLAGVATAAAAYGLAPFVPDLPKWVALTGVAVIGVGLLIARAPASPLAAVIVWAIAAGSELPHHGTWTTTAAAVAGTVVTAAYSQPISDTPADPTVIDAEIIDEGTTP